VRVEVVGRMDRHAKIEKINAEIARMEVEYELECGVSGVHLGTKLGVWDSMFGKTTTEAQKLRNKANDINIFETKVLNPVCMKLGMSASQLISSDPVYAGGRIKGLIPACVWRMQKNDKIILVLFWTGEAASYSVMCDTGSGDLDSGMMGASHVWSAAKKTDDQKTKKNYSVIRAQMHGILLLRAGELEDYNVD
jgi:hypothetical protein